MTVVSQVSFTLMMEALASYIVIHKHMTLENKGKLLQKTTVHLIHKCVASYVARIVSKLAM